MTWNLHLPVGLITHASTAVLTVCGFNAKKDLLAQLLALNQEVAANIEKGSPTTAPGVPKNYPGAKKLVTEDCIRPQSSGIDNQHAVKLNS